MSSVFGLSPTYTSTLRIYLLSLRTALILFIIELGVESYQKSLNIIKPQKSISKIKHYPPYTTYPMPFGIVYECRDAKKRFLKGLTNNLMASVFGLSPTYTSTLRIYILSLRIALILFIIEVFQLVSNICKSSYDTDWARDYGLGLDSKEPLPLVGPKLNRRIPLENFFNEDIEYLKTKNKELKGRKLKRCLNVNKLNLSKLEEFIKDGYELFGNAFMSKAEYDYNMDQMTIAMSYDTDWARDYGLGLDSKEPLPLVGPKLNRRIPLENFFNEDIEYLKTKNKELKGRKYAFSVTKRHVAE
nr:hypothetical protein [Tanacetum cinerariifolium]